MDIFQFINVNWGVIISINLLTHFIKTRIPGIKSWCAYLVLIISALYAIVAGLISGIGLFPSLEAGFLHAAVASYVYSLYKSPAESTTGANIKDKIRTLTNKRG